MTKKKPGRWDRIAEKLWLSDDLTGIDVANAFRKEHRAVVRIVEKRLPESWSMNAPDAYVNGYQHALSIILDRLTKRAT